MSLKFGFCARAQKPGVPYLVEPIRREDLPEVVGIEMASFAVPWTEEMFAHELAQEGLSEILVARATWAGSPPPIVGYICVWVVAGELHINNLAVTPRWRRRGAAAALLEAALERARLRGVGCAFLEVRASNVAAQSLYRRYGFEPAGVRRRFYEQPPEDAIIMRRAKL